MKMTRTQKTEQARKQVEGFLNLHLPGSGWKITRSSDAIFPESHGGRHTMGLYSAFCILKNMESGKLLQDAQAHLDRYASDILIPFIQQKQSSLVIECSKCDARDAYDEAHENSVAFNLGSRVKPDFWADELWKKGWRIQDQTCLCPKCKDKN